MNTKNNRRLKSTDEQIVRAVYEMLVTEKRPLERVTVREVCERASIHRSTFYAHYQDVFEVAERVEAHMARDLTLSFMDELDRHANARSCFTKLFEFIRQYREFYAFYLDESRNTSTISVAWDLIKSRTSSFQPDVLGAENQRELEYCSNFLLHGLSAMVRTWIQGGCQESPEQLYDILCHQSGMMRHMLEW